MNQQHEIESTNTYHALLTSFDDLFKKNIGNARHPAFMEADIAAFRTQLEHISRAADLFLNHHGPNLQVTNEGAVMMQNNAANNLNYLVVNNKKVSAANYWASLAKNCHNPNQIVSDEETGKYYLFKAVSSANGKEVTISGYPVNDPQLFNNYEVKREPGSTFINDLIENLHDGILIEDREHNLLFANNKLCSLFSYPHDAATLRGAKCSGITKNAIKLFKNPKAFLHKTRELIQNNIHVINDIIELNDGRFFKRDFIPLVDHDGESMGNMWVYNDITQVYTSENAIEAQRIFYESIIQNLPVDIAVVGPDHRYRFLSNSTVKNAEVRKWMIGKTDAEYCAFRNLGSAFADNRQKKLEAALETKKPVRWEEERTHSDGSTQFHLRVLNPVQDQYGNVTHLLGYGINLTERKQIEEMVKLSEKRYRQLFQVSPAIILTHDFNGIITSINPALEQLLGYSAETAIGRLLSDFLPEKGKEIFTAYMAGVKQLQSTEGVFRIDGKDGKKRYLLFKNAVVKEDDSEPNVIAFAQDITERIRAEKELEVARQATEENSKAKERFLANMSHEIRTPMNGIIGIANLLKKTRLSEQQENYLSLILESANNLIVIINDILDLEKINAGKLEFESIPFNLTEKVRHVAQSFHYKAEEKDIALSIQYSVPDSLYLLGDPYRLSQILTNLINNAIKFTSKGHVNIQVSQNIKNSESTVINITVTDTGTGISPDKLSIIFDPYTQERSEISRKYGGTGLGLAITKNLVSMQGGTLNVQSTPGEGSTFSISLPYATTLKPIEEPNLPGSFNVLKGKEILVAEDVEINQFLVKHLLEGWGCTVHLVPDGKKALELAATHNFDAVLMDIQMPVMDGIESTRHIRDLADRKKALIPIVALTANALKGDDVKYLAAGMNDYITKPFSEKSLYNVLVKVMGTDIAKQEKQDQQDSSTMQTCNSNSAKPYDLSGLEAMSGNDPAFLPMMAKLFLDTVPDVLSKLNQAYANGDLAVVGNLAHKLKPTIDAMNIHSLTRVIRSVEQNTRQELDTESLGDNLKLINNTLLTCIEHLKIEFSL